MSNGDFEVMPRGTMDEIRALRRFANDMIALNNIHDMPVPHEMFVKINEIAQFYAAHNQKYPSL